MDIIEKVLAIWGLISLVAVIISFFFDNFEYSDDVSIIDAFKADDINCLYYYFDYPQNEQSCEHTLFVANKHPIKNIKIHKYNIEKENWEKGIKICNILEINNGIILNIDRPEGLAMHKVSWKSTYGKSAEYIFSYNGFSGNHSRTVITYYYNIVAKIRKIFKIK